MQNRPIIIRFQFARATFEGNIEFNKNRVFITKDEESFEVCVTSRIPIKIVKSVHIWTPHQNTSPLVKYNCQLDRLDDF